jgi:hypothetical protein
MKLQLRKIRLAGKAKRGAARESVNEILRESYRRFAKDKFTRQTVKLFL